MRHRRSLRRRRLSRRVVYARRAELAIAAVYGLASRLREETFRRLF